jgi:hypothetical protein
MADGLLWIWLLPKLLAKLVHLLALDTTELLGILKKVMLVFLLLLLPLLLPVKLLDSKIW